MSSLRRALAASLSIPANRNGGRSQRRIRNNSGNSQRNDEREEEIVGDSENRSITVSSSVESRGLTRTPSPRAIAAMHEPEVGGRVRVRFNSQRWYGGVISEVNLKLGKIHILYDDGTQEDAKYPDADIVIYPCAPHSFKRSRSTEDGLNRPAPLKRIRPNSNDIENCSDTDIRSCSSNCCLSKPISRTFSDPEKNISRKPPGRHISSNPMRKEESNANDLKLRREPCIEPPSYSSIPNVDPVQSTKSFPFLDNTSEVPKEKELDVVRDRKLNNIAVDFDLVSSINHDNLNIEFSKQSRVVVNRQKSFEEVSSNEAHTNGVQHSAILDKSNLTELKKSVNAETSFASEAFSGDRILNMSENHSNSEEMYIVKETNINIVHVNGSGSYSKTSTSVDLLPSLNDSTGNHDLKSDANKKISLNSPVIPSTDEQFNACNSESPICPTSLECNSSVDSPLKMDRIYKLKSERYDEKSVESSGIAPLACESSFLRSSFKNDDRNQTVRENITADESSNTFATKGTPTELSDPMDEVICDGRGTETNDSSLDINGSVLLQEKSESSVGSTGYVNGKFHDGICDSVMNSQSIPVLIVEAQWAQCDTCNRWRKLPPSVNPDSLPDEWTCADNTWDPLHNSCADKEESDVLPDGTPGNGEAISTSWSGTGAVSSDSKLRKPTKRHNGMSTHVQHEYIDRDRRGTSTQVNDKYKFRGKFKRDKKASLKFSSSDNESDNQDKRATFVKGTARNKFPNGSVSVNSRSVLKQPPHIDVRGDNNSSEPIIMTHKWVQCDHSNCQKWRQVPHSVDLPAHWYCDMNTWNPDRASCSVPDDSELADLAVNVPCISLRTESVSSEMESEKKIKSKDKLRKTIIPQPYPNRGKQRPAGMKISEFMPSKEKSRPNIVSNSAKVFASKVKLRHLNSETNSESARRHNVMDTEDEEMQTSDSSVKCPESKKNEIRWVQCDKKDCKKWRKLPQGVDPQSLPEKWYCHMNTWSTERASCSVPEDTAEEISALPTNHTTESASTMGRKNIGGRFNILAPPSKTNGKLCYRSMLFTNDGRLKAPFNTTCPKSDNLFPELLNDFSEEFDDSQSDRSVFPEPSFTSMLETMRLTDAERVKNEMKSRGREIDVDSFMNLKKTPWPPVSTTHQLPLKLRKPWKLENVDCPPSSNLDTYTHIELQSNKNIPPTSSESCKMMDQYASIPTFKDSALKLHFHGKAAVNHFTENTNMDVDEQNNATSSS